MEWPNERRVGKLPTLDGHGSHSMCTVLSHILEPGDLDLCLVTLEVDN